MPAGMRMRLAVHLAQPFNTHMSVYLGSRQALVSEHLLHNADIRAVIDQMRCEGMPERMRADLLRNSGFSHVLFYYHCNSALGNPASAKINQQGVCRIGIILISPDILQRQILGEGLHRPSAEVYDPVLAALSPGL